MHIGDFVRTLYEDDLQSAAARRENGELLAGVRVATGACDDHEIHLAEHRRAALEYSYSKMKRSDPVRAQALADHIAEHVKICKENKDNGKL